MYWLIPILLLTPQATVTHEEFPLIVVWNVGQGQWVTLSNLDHCLHFDIGGEQFPSKALLHYCRKKKNIAYFSHWDWDHIRLARRAHRVLTNLCILAPPLGIEAPKKVRFLKALPACDPQKILAEINELSLPQSPVYRDSNEASRIFLIHDFFLNPGDSYQKQEKIWLQHLSPQNKISTLLLGHHGSNTSTGHALLKRLKNLKVGIASARFKRYRHPHWSVEGRLKQYGVSLLRTEDWGNIVIPLPLHQSRSRRGDTPNPNHEPLEHRSHTRYRHSAP